MKVKISRVSKWEGTHVGVEDADEIFDGILL